jgi:hypothetical protein
MERDFKLIVRADHDRLRWCGPCSDSQASSKQISVALFHLMPSQFLGLNECCWYTPGAGNAGNMPTSAIRRQHDNS